MKNTTANSVYANSEFDELQSDKSNISCFDCGKGPASWASVNNSIYLCLTCAGNHRGFGVNISYIRSITIDTWNETQMAYMKLGGNKRLEDLMALYEVPRTTHSNVLFGSKLLEYHRNQIKNEVNKGAQLIPIKIEEALIPIESVKLQNNQNSSNNSNENKSNYYSVSGSSDFNENKNNQNGGFLSSMGSMFNKVVEKGKNVATNVKDKVGELDLKNKLQSTGAKTVEVLYEAGNLVKDTTIKGVEVIKDTSGKVVAKGKEYGVKIYFFILKGNSERKGN